MTKGERGPAGVPGKDVLSKRQTLRLFLFVVFAFFLLAARSEYNDGNINENKRIVDEICLTHPDLAPDACERRS